MKNSTIRAAGAAPDSMPIRLAFKCLAVCIHLPAWWLSSVASRERIEENQMIPGSQTLAPKLAKRVAHAWAGEYYAVEMGAKGAKIPYREPIRMF